MPVTHRGQFPSVDKVVQPESRRRASWASGRCEYKAAFAQMPGQRLRVHSRAETPSIQKLIAENSIPPSSIVAAILSFSVQFSE